MQKTTVLQKSRFLKNFEIGNLISTIKMQFRKKHFFCIRAQCGIEPKNASFDHFECRTLSNGLKCVPITGHYHTDFCEVLNQNEPKKKSVLCQILGK